MNLLCISYFHFLSVNNILVSSFYSSHHILSFNLFCYLLSISHIAFSLITISYIFYFSHYLLSVNHFLLRSTHFSILHALSELFNPILCFSSSQTVVRGQQIVRYTLSDDLRTTNGPLDIIR